MKAKERKPKARQNQEYKVVPQHGIRLPKYQSVGHAIGDLLWWVDDRGIIHWQIFNGHNYHHEISSLDFDARWRGRLELDKSGTATLLPPVKLYSRKPDDLMSHLPTGALITLTHLGAKLFYMDTPKGLVRLKKCRVDRRRKV